MSGVYIWLSIFEPVCVFLTMHGLEKTPNKFEHLHPILDFFKVIKDVCRAVIPNWKKKSSKESLKTPNYRNVHAHDKYTQECMMSVCKPITYMFISS